MPLVRPSRRRLLSCLGAVLAAGLTPGRRGATQAPEAQTLEFNSPYNFVRMEKKGSLVTFAYVIGGGDLSAVDLANPGYQVMVYTGYFYAAELVRPGPRRALMAGLGAGSFNRLFDLVHPGARLVSLEIDPMIVRLAEEHTGFRAGPDDEVVIDDARVFLRRSRETYDWILLDAFNREGQIPVHLTTREFVRVVHGRLAEDGVMLANLFQGTRYFASHVLTIRTVFPNVVLLPVGDDLDNTIVVATKTPGAPIRLRPEALGLDERARYRAKGVDLARIARSAVHERDYLPLLERHGIVLTDDYAPVESLDRERMPYIEPPPQPQ